MSPTIEQLQQTVTRLENRVNELILADRYRFIRDIEVGASRGVKIGTKSTQKLSVYGVAPVAQQTAITAPSGGATQDTQARTAITTIITALKNFGITA